MTTGVSAQGANRSLYDGIKPHPDIQAIEKQIEFTQKRIQELKANESLDPKVKQEKLEMLEKQMQELKTRKSQRQMELRREEREKASLDLKGVDEKRKETAEAKKKPQNDVIEEGIQDAFIKSDTYLSTERELSPLRAKYSAQMDEASRSSYNKPADPAGVSEAGSKITKLNGYTLEAKEGAEKAFEDAKEEKAEDATEKAEELEQEKEKELKPGRFIDEVI